MCELLGLSARLPTQAELSLSVFSDHGGGIGPHKDGWGAAFYQGKDAWLIRSTESASGSGSLAFTLAHAPATTLMIAHIRLATHGSPSLANTQPFTFPLLGHKVTLAHNGHVPGILNQPWLRLYQPVGETDSEQVFSILLAWMDELSARSDQDRFTELEKRLRALAELGPLNLLFSDGQCLFAFSNKRTQKDGRISAPGMHWLKRTCDTSAALTQDDTDTRQQRVLLFASVPLTNEVWQPLPADRLWVAHKGDLIFGEAQQHSASVAASV